VIYDRRESAFALSAPEMYDWEKILSGADAFFFTGITPALSDALPGIVSDAFPVDGISLSRGDRYFTAYCDETVHKDKDLRIFYFIEDTALKRTAIAYDYKSSGIDYTKGSYHAVSETHSVLATDEEFARWSAR
jgi:hypothetical protein